MTYLSLDVIETPLYGMKHITVRGTLDNMFFRWSDVEDGLKVSIRPQTPYVWVNTPSGREKYLSHTTLKRIQPISEQIDVYLNWIDAVLSEPFEKPQETCSDSTSDCDSITDSDYSWRSSERLQHELEIAKKDNEIYRERLQVKEKEIEMLKLRISLLNTNMIWV